MLFSSRSRHAISGCDWMSDVCSSDLAKYPISSVRGGEKFLSRFFCRGGILMAGSLGEGSGDAPNGELVLGNGFLSASKLVLGAFEQDPQFLNPPYSYPLLLEIWTMVGFFFQGALQPSCKINGSFKDVLLCYGPHFFPTFALLPFGLNNNTPFPLSIIHIIRPHF